MSSARRGPLLLALAATAALAAPGSAAAMPAGPDPPAGTSSSRPVPRYGLSAVAEVPAPAPAPAPSPAPATATATPTGSGGSGIDPALVVLLAASGLVAVAATGATYARRHDHRLGLP